MGFTIPQIDDILVPYCEKSYNKYFEEYRDMVKSMGFAYEFFLETKEFCEVGHRLAMSKVKRDLEQGFQGLEIKLNTVASSRGDYIFVTITFGLNTTEFGSMITEAILKVRKEGQGKEGHKKVLPFPKLVFIYNEELHGEGKEFEYLFDKAIECSSKAMYPKRNWGL